MSTTNKTSTSSQYSNQYDPGSMGVFGGLQGSIGSNLQDFMRNPLQSSFFNTQLAMAQQANQQRFQAGNSTMMNNAVTGGYMGNLPAFLQSQLLRNQRSLSADNSNSFNNLLLGANQLRFGATQNAMGYRPLQTGGRQSSTSIQSQGGLGSWMSPLLSAGMGLATGGMSTLAQGAGSFFSGAGARAFNPSLFNSQTGGGPAGLPPDIGIGNGPSDMGNMGVFF